MVCSSCVLSSVQCFVESSLSGFAAVVNLYRRRCYKGRCLLWGARVVVPYKLQKRILEDLHHDHGGAVRMNSIARSFMWGSGMDIRTLTLANACACCKAVLPVSRHYTHGGGLIFRGIVSTLTLPGLSVARCFAGSGCLLEVAGNLGNVIHHSRQYHLHPQTYLCIIWPTYPNSSCGTTVVSLYPTGLGLMISFRPMESSIFAQLPHISSGPVEEHQGPVLYQVQLETGKDHHKHVDHLCEWTP